MPYYDAQSFYEPGQVVTQTQGMPFTVPGSQTGGFDFTGLGQGLGQLAQQTLAMRQQQALQQMALAQREQALREAQFAASSGLAQQQFDYQRQQDAQQQMQMGQDRYKAENEARRARVAQGRARSEANLGEAAYGQEVGGFGIVPGMISASGNTPGAVMTGFRQSAQGPTSFMGSMGMSRASMPEFSPMMLGSPEPQQASNEAGIKSARARRELLQRRALGM